MTQSQLLNKTKVHNCKRAETHNLTHVWTLKIKLGFRVTCETAKIYLIYFLAGQSSVKLHSLPSVPTEKQMMATEG